MGTNLFNSNSEVKANNQNLERAIWYTEKQIAYFAPLGIKESKARNSRLAYEERNEWHSMEAVLAVSNEFLAELKVLMAIYPTYKKAEEYFR